MQYFSTKACSCGYNFIFKICIWKNIECQIWFLKMCYAWNWRLPRALRPSSSLTTFLTACLDGSRCALVLSAFRQCPTLLDSTWFWVAWLGNKHKGIARLGTEFSGGVCLRGSTSIPIPQTERWVMCVSGIFSDHVMIEDKKKLWETNVKKIQ